MFDFPVFGAEPQRHSCGHCSQDIGFDTVSESIGENRDKPFFCGDAFKRHGVAARLFFEVTALCKTGIDKEVAGIHAHSSSSS